MSEFWFDAHWHRGNCLASETSESGQCGSVLVEQQTESIITEQPLKRT